MQKYKNNLSIILALVALVSTIWLYFTQPERKRIAYVRSSDLVYGYLGMQDAHRKYEEQSKSWQANIDTLKNEYQRSVNNYTAAQFTMSELEKQQGQQALERQHKDLMQYAQALNSKAKEEDNKITEGVLNQINAFVEGYGKQNGYDVILGTTLSGSLLYGEETIDITKDVLDALNRDYKGDNGN